MNGCGMFHRYIIIRLFLSQGRKHVIISLYTRDKMTQLANVVTDCIISSAVVPTQHLIIELEL